MSLKALNFLVYFMAIWYIVEFLWYILWPFGIFYRFGTLYQEKSGNPDTDPGTGMLIFKTRVIRGS
jgi:hypothetical protein